MAAAACWALGSGLGGAWAQQGQGAATPILTGTVQPVGGPKRVVAVGKFDAVGSFKAQYGDWDIGGGMAAMLSTALVESQRFIVVERANVQQVLAEQELKGQKLTAPGTGPELGRLIGAQYLIYGAITEFGAADSGGGLSVGLPNLGPVGLNLGTQGTKGSVAMDIRVVDTTTGELMENFTVKEKIESSSLDVGVNVKQMSFGGNKFNKTPLGEACRRCITKAVNQFAGYASKSAWTGRVVEADGREVFINAGTTSNIKVGDRFRVYRYSRVLTDPDTGKVLSKREQDVGTVEIATVEEKIASGFFTASGAEVPARGDMVGLVR